MSLYFLHIPKTAGTSIHIWLSRKFAHEDVFPDVNPADALAASPFELSKYKYFGGHYGLTFAERFPKRPSVISWLRDPASRLLSTYKYLRTMSAADALLLSSEWSRRQWKAAQNMSFDEWIKLPQASYAIHNHMAYSLAPEDACDESVLKDAIGALERLDAFGIVERMQDSVDQVCYTMGWLPEHFALHENASRGEVVLSERTLNVIRVYNSIDYALYERALQIFMSRQRRMDSVLGVEEGDLGARTKALARSFRTSERTAYGMNEGWVPITSRFAGAGWQRPLADAHNPSLRLRWSGPEAHSEIFLGIPDDGAILLWVEILAVMDAEILRSLQMSLNEHDLSVHLEHVPRPGFPYAHICSAVAPRAAIIAHSGLARLTFSVSKTFTSEFQEQLGFCVEGVRWKRLPSQAKGAENHLLEDGFEASK